MANTWIIKCFNCGEEHSVEADGTTDHICAAAGPSEDPSTAAAKDPILDWLESTTGEYKEEDHSHIYDHSHMMRRRATTTDGADLSAVNLALGLERDGTGTMSLNSNNSFPSYLDNASSGMQRQAPSAMSQQQANNNAANGGGALNGVGIGMPMNAGQQMDMNYLYQKLTELGAVLKDNREKTQGIVASAEELATRAAATGDNPSLQEANHEVTAARIAELTRQLTHEQHKCRILMREQRENTKLIGEFETGVGHIVELVRNYSYAQNMEKAQVAREYNKLLQDEKDAHLESRLEKDDWMAKAIRYGEMIRTAYGLACEDHVPVIRVVAGLQNEVRAYRNALGMEPEKFEDEFGYEVLKDVKNGAGEP